MMPMASMRSSKMKAVLIACLVILLAVFTWIIPPRAEWLHNILHHLNILPFMLAGLFFGWRGSLKTILFAIVLQTPSIYRHWHAAPTDAQDQIVELSTFGAAGIIAGVLSDRERTLRMRVETTKHELETVHFELQQNIEHLRKTERLTAAGQLSASLAHEIRNPLASISGAAGILSRGQASEGSRRECLEILTKESQRLNKLLTNFLIFARPRLPRLQQVEANDLLRSVTTLAQHATAERNIKLQLKLTAIPEKITCDPEQIRQLLLNLFLNAIQASPEGGVVSMATSLAEGQLVIEVSDEGEGITGTVAERIFDPFFTTKTTGTGLGLAIAATIASQHAGTLTYKSNSPRGACFLLHLPLATTHIPSNTVKAAQ
jgi:signal transduction histidine kinase